MSKLLLAKQAEKAEKSTKRHGREMQGWLRCAGIEVVSERIERHCVGWLI